MLWPMAEFTLLDGPTQLLERARSTFGDHLRGRTAVAAHRRHRYSTDLEYFIQPGHYAVLHTNRERFDHGLQLATGGV